MAELDDSILNTTKKLLGISEDYPEFDMDIIVHINSTFATLAQLGLSSADGFEIEDDTALWADVLENQKLLNAVKSYVYLKVRLLFDPPTTSFAIESFAKQIGEYEFRINVQLEELFPPEPNPYAL